MYLARPMEDLGIDFFQGASLLRSEGGPRLNRLWSSSAPGAGKGLFRPRMHPAPIGIYSILVFYEILAVISGGSPYFI